MQVNPQTGRVHTCYNQAVTATGRLSSTDPNLQNIPIRNEEGRRIRQAFIAPKGYKIMSADYSQIEIRIMAHISKDPGLLRAFEYNQDIHTATAAEVFGIPVDQVSSEERRVQKPLISVLFTACLLLGCLVLWDRQGSAKDYITRYFERYPLFKAI